MPPSYLFPPIDRARHPTPLHARFSGKHGGGCTLPFFSSVTFDLASPPPLPAIHRAGRTAYVDREDAAFSPPLFSVPLPFPPPQRRSTRIPPLSLRSFALEVRPRKGEILRLADALCFPPLLSPFPLFFSADDHEEELAPRSR